MDSLNQVQLMGNLGDDPEMRYTPTGRPVTTMSLATDRRYKDDNGELKSIVTWHKIVAWDKLAETCNQFLGKGDGAYIQGRINNLSWTDKDGNTRKSSEIVAGRVIFLTRKGQESPDSADLLEPEPVAAFPL